jgi:23S rRNA pseudouridine1911/1915/1917 synthase
LKTEKEIADGRDQEELYEHYRFQVDKGQALMRIDKYLVNQIGNTSRNRVQHACFAESILVNGKAIKPNYKVKPGDDIQIVLPEPVRVLELVPENIPINIVYEDDDLVIVNKQAGMVVHPAYGNYRGTLANALLYHFGTLPHYGEMMEQPGLVHRIDKSTSGLMVIAKTELALTQLAKEFYERTIERLYYALVWGDFTEDSGTITGHIGRHLIDRKRMEVYPEGNHGKHAITHNKVIERFGYITLVQCKLETGRTHQIRVHMRYSGHSVFNDPDYLGNRIVKGTTFTKYKQFVENCFSILGQGRQALHAATLGFVHPRTQEKISFQAEMPDDMQQVLEKWRNYTANKLD